MTTVYHPDIIRLARRVMQIEEATEVKIGGKWEKLEYTKRCADGGDALAGAVLQNLEREKAKAAPILARAILGL